MKKETIRRFPPLPGVYLMKDAEGEVIYVGKAVNLRARVGSYFRPSGDGRPLIPYLMARVAGIECLVTDTEKEALILENNLIKKHRPRYNVFFRDDKTYSSIRIDPAEEYPRPVRVRRVRADGALYFGPYAAGRSLKSTLRFLQKLFPHRVCSDAVFRGRSRPCLYHQLGRCPAPCRGLVSPERYRENVEALILFLRGRNRELLSALRRRMDRESAELRYEEAARTRDRIRAVEETLEKQKVSRVELRDRDVFALERGEGASLFQVLSLRSGRMLDGRSFFFDREFPEPAQALSSFLLQFYSGPTPVPDEIVLPFAPAFAEGMREILRERRGRAVRLVVPRRGVKRDWLRLAEKNARASLRVRRSRPAPAGVLESLREKLGLRRTPRVIECYDISNLGGREAVGAAAVFRDGERYSSGYRSYRVRISGKPDDFAMLSEVLTRRFRRTREEGDRPDLILVDGGKGQLSAALRAREESGADWIDLAALAKDRRGPSGRAAGDRVFIPGRKNPVALRPGSPELLLLARIRDEAHRFALAYHRRVRSRESFRSPLDGVRGIGPARKRLLLERFGTLEKIAAAGSGEVAAVGGIGRKRAEAIVAALKNRGGAGAEAPRE